jgi:hypothetical protein
VTVQFRSRRFESGYNAKGIDKDENVIKGKREKNKENVK